MTKLSQLKIDPEFQKQINPPSFEETHQLEMNILKEERVLNPIITWNGYIVDGHTRYQVLRKYPFIPFEVIEKEFANRYEALVWICKNQLGRRNLTPEQKKFFDELPKGAFSLTNLDDKNGLVMTQNTRSKVYTYSLRSLSDFKGKVLESHFEGMLLDFNNHELAVRFIGKFNAYNLLAVFGTAVLLGKKEEDVLVALSTLRPVTGRFDAIRSPKGYTAIVDYAHTPDALVNVLNAIHGVLEGKGKVITVVGAGGNRDKGKRPIMAKESARLSDRVIITSDNPRFEEPQDIINDMLAGLDKDDMQKTISITDRREAIKTACMLAQPGDVILVAGKGHENYQEIKGVKHHFDDKEILNEIIK